MTKAYISLAILAAALGGCSYDSSLPGQSDGGPGGIDGAGALDASPVDAGFDADFDAAPQCNNGVREGNEVCDGADFGDQTCASQGFVQGDLQCIDECESIDTSACFDCPLLAGTNTVGLWCFEEGTGNSSDSLVPGAEPITLQAGGALPWAAGGGLDLNNQPLQLPSSAALELPSQWRVEVAATVDSISADDVMLFERTAFPGQATEVQHWLRMYLDQDGSVQCDTGRETQNLSYRGARSSAGAFTVGSEHIFACERDGFGELHTLVDGTDVTTSHFGGGANGFQHASTIDTNIAGGNNSAPFVGTLRAVAIHDTYCDIDLVPGTAGLWCLTEGTGTTSANAVSGGEPAEGIEESEWLIGQGLSLSDSAVVVNDDASLDLAPPWSLTALVTIDEQADSTIIERASFDGTNEDAWVSLRSQADGTVLCSVGSSSAGDYATVESSAGALSIGERHRIECRRAAAGELSLVLDGADASSTRTGSPSSTTYAANQGFTIGFSDCPSAQCSDRTSFRGQVLAWALRSSHSAEVVPLWSGVQGQDSLNYMSFSGSTFSNMSLFEAGTERWRVSSGAQCFIGRDDTAPEQRGQLHSLPGSSGGIEFPSPVIRWTAPAAANVVVHTRVMSPFVANSGTGTTRQRYYVNGVLVFTEALTELGYTNYSRTLSGISAGDTIEYELHSAGSSASDTTFWQYLSFDQPSP